MFLPCTKEEMAQLGWEQADIILVSGDAYVDSPFSGTAVIGHVLLAAGFKTAILPQPQLGSTSDILRLGSPRLFWGVSSGCVDSMVANYTATGKRRQQDDFTPGEKNTARPDRAVIAYCNAIRSACKPCPPIVIGGIEASLRRIAHYDFWSDTVRRPLLFDAKADICVYGMGERTIVELARCLRDQNEWRLLRGICYACPERDLQDVLGSEPFGVLPAYADVAVKDDSGRRAFLTMFDLFYRNQEARTARTLVQKNDTRVLVHRPPAFPLTAGELDEVYGLPFAYDAHPMYRKLGKIRALDTIRFSVTTHRGCYGECNFCAIAVHQGRAVVSRSEASIIEEVRRLSQHPRFTGTLQDVGGPTANMYGFECSRKMQAGACPDKRCLYPQCCSALKPTHQAQIRLLKKLRQLPGVKHVFVASGIRPDLVANDAACGEAYLDELVSYHVSGQLKLAPEHSVPRILHAMGKPDTTALLHFKERFDAINRRKGLRQFLTYYFIAAHPGCTLDDMRALRQFVLKHLKLTPEQVQIFTPTPSTWSTAMYYTGIDPVTGKGVNVVKSYRERVEQKDCLTGPVEPWHPREASPGHQARKRPSS